MSKKELSVAFKDFTCSHRKEAGEELIKFTDIEIFGVIINTEKYFPQYWKKEMRDGPEDQKNKDEMEFRNTKYKAMNFWNVTTFFL